MLLDASVATAAITVLLRVILHLISLDVAGMTKPFIHSFSFMLLVCTSCGKGFACLAMHNPCTFRCAEPCVLCCAGILYAQLCRNLVSHCQFAAQVQDLKKRLAALQKDTDFARLSERRAAAEEKQQLQVWYHKSYKPDFCELDLC